MDTLFCNPNNGTTSIQLSSIVDAQSNPKTRSLLMLMRGADRVYLCVFFPLSYLVPLEGGNLVLSVREVGRGGGEGGDFIV